MPQRDHRQIARENPLRFHVERPTRLGRESTTTGEQNRVELAIRVPPAIAAGARVRRRRHRVAREHPAEPPRIREVGHRQQREVESTAAKIREQRGDVKNHEKQLRGNIGALFQDQGYGFIVSPDGYDVYFHENSVVNKDFKKLAVGMDVTFSEEMGDKGPQASSVIVLR